MGLLCASQVSPAVTHFLNNFELSSSKRHELFALCKVFSYKEFLSSKISKMPLIISVMFLKYG
jgi:hypothetical protein